MKALFKLGFIVFAVLVALAFIGVQPLADYKDEILTKVDRKASDIVQAIAPNEETALALGVEIVQVVNRIRGDEGLDILVWDDALYAYSLAHSQAMAKEKRLFHTDMNAPYAENAWGGEGSKYWDADTIVNSWMDSPRHQTWLLCPTLKHVAVGVVYSDNGMYASWTFWRNETSLSDWWY